MGYQVQQNLHVPTCYPGIVCVSGEQYPPKKSKWDKVRYQQDQVQVDRKQLTGRPDAMMRPKSIEPFDHTKLKEIMEQAPKRWRFVLAGIACSGARPMVSANTHYVRAKALCGRAFLSQEPAAWGEGPAPWIWRWVRKFVPILLPEFRAPELDFEVWLASMPGVRRKILRKAWEKYSRNGWKPSYRRFKAFVKSELLPGFGKTKLGLDRLTEMIDRLIQGPHDATHCIAGPKLKPFVAALKKIWTADGPIFYGSVGPEPLQKFLDKLVASPGTYFWCDFSMFDVTHSRDSWDFMHHLYWKGGIADPEFWRVLKKAWLAPRGSIGPFSYKANVMNASGRDDTALANGILNGFATYLSAIAAYLRKPLCTLTEKDVLGARSYLLLSVCGDDSIGRLPFMTAERKLEFHERMARNIRMFGFEAKLASSERLIDAVYLGNRPYPSATGWRWGRTIGRATYKMGWVTVDKDRDVMAHITGIADMHLRCSSHVPVLSDLAEKIVELRVGAKRTPVLPDPNRPWEWGIESGVKYDAETIEAVAQAYTTSASPYLPGCEQDQVVTSADVLDLIRTIRGVGQLPCVVDHWLWKRMVLVDDL